MPESEFIKIPREPYPGCKLPDDHDTPVWRYMDMNKFESLLREKALYLCRADRLEDRFEGTYSRRQLLEMENYFQENNIPHMVESERKRRRKYRQQTYLSCWCVGYCDLDLMWKGYIRNPPGIAIKSSVKRLINICDSAVEYWPLDISTVTYFDHAGGKYIPYCGTPTRFLHKDNHFKLDNELRIIHYPNFSIPTPTHVFLKIDLNALIETIVFQPKTKESSLKHVRESLAKAGLDKIPILASRDDRGFLE